MTSDISNTLPFDYAAYLQIDVRLADIDANLSQVKNGLVALTADRSRESLGLVAIPELWATGFAYNDLPNLAGRMPSVLEAIQELAAEHNICLAGSLPETATDSAGTRYYNTLYLVGPDGIIGSYRKQHLFPPMQEDTFFSPGKNPQPIETPWGPVACLVCYDLRFPELVRCQATRGATILVIAAQWPLKRKEHWQTLVRARAIENQIYVIAANRCGTTSDTSFAGHSMIVSPDGEVLCQAGTEEESAGIDLDPGLVKEVRSRFNTVLPE